MNRTENAAYYKQAMCYGEWARKENAFGERMCCQLYLNQLLECEGNYPDETLVNTKKVVDTFCEMWEDKAFCNRVRHLMYNKEYDELQNEAHSLLEKYYDDSALCYEYYDINRWCSDCGDMYLSQCQKLSDLQKGHLVVRGSGLISLMCKYLPEDVLDELDTYEDLLIKLHSMLYSTEAHYCPMFKRWCAVNCISDKDAEHARLMKLYHVDTDAKLEECIKLNMVE